MKPIIFAIRARMVWARLIAARARGDAERCGILRAHADVGDPREFSLTNEDWNLITRTLLPAVCQGSPAEGISSECGRGDLNPSFFFSPAKPWHGLIRGIGPTFEYPTGTEPESTTGKWSAGPAPVVLRRDGPWSYGCLVIQLWSFHPKERNNLYLSVQLALEKVQVDRLEPYRAGLDELP